MDDFLQDRDEDAEDVRSVYLYGDETDCDTCGWNSDTGEFHLWPDGRFYLSTRYGCYSGNYTETKEGVLGELKHCTGFMDIEHETEQIKELLNV